MPYELDEPTFSGTDASINQEKKKKEIFEKVHIAAYQSIIDQIFESICPNFLDDPERSFSQIKQTDNESDFKLTVTQYYAVAMALLNNFRRDKGQVWNNDPAAHFVNNMNENVLAKMEENMYKDHLGGASTKPFDQIALMSKAYRLAIIAENSIKSTSKLIEDKMTEVHGLITMTPVLQSSAESTIREYSREYPKGCWGCGENHAWMKKKSKDILCPNKDKPGVRKNAEDNFRAFKNSMKAKRKNTDEKQATNKPSKWHRNMLSDLLKDPESMKLLRSSMSGDSDTNNTK